MSGEVFFIDGFVEPVLHHGRVDVVVVGPVFVAGVVGGVDVYAFDFSGVGGEEGF